MYVIFFISFELFEKLLDEEIDDLFMFLIVLSVIVGNKNWSLIVIEDDLEVYEVDEEDELVLDVVLLDDDFEFNLRIEGFGL